MWWSAGCRERSRRHEAAAARCWRFAAAAARRSRSRNRSASTSAPPASRARQRGSCSSPRWSACCRSRHLLVMVDRLHPHRHRALAAAQRDRRAGHAAQPGAGRPRAVPDLLRDAAGAGASLDRRAAADDRRAGSASWRGLRPRAEPFRRFMAAQSARARPLAFPRPGEPAAAPATAEQTPWRALVPAFMVSELRAPSRSASCCSCRSW